MNAVEIADAVAELAGQPFNAREFPFDFLVAFDNKETTITRLKKGDTNSSDIPGGVLQKNNVHIAVCHLGQVAETLVRLRNCPKTAAAKAKFILATDGETLEAEDLRTGEPLACGFRDLADHFGFFLPLANISTLREIKDNPIDVRATGRLNKLYVELLRTNQDWQTEARRSDLNHFFARLIFCFFAEDTHIFIGDGLFTHTVQQMTEADGGNVHQVLRNLFLAMNLNPTERKGADLPAWADGFPYVNGGLFSDDLQIPKFNRTARSYLLRAGELNWREINPDIFGSMIQAVADDEERGALGMHYTSVPNILKVLNPLFLDDLREQLDKAGEHKASLLKLRERISRIRVFDPACGSGNFLVIAYKEMRKIEAQINRRRGEVGKASEIPPTNFRGIEIRDFAAEIARLALVIAEYQCDVLHRGERFALAEFLPLNNENWIWKGNALRLDWATVCPSEGTGVKVKADNLFEDPLDQTEMDFANTGGETYICGNPPYSGFTWQTEEQKADLASVFARSKANWKSFDYVAGWFLKAAQYSHVSGAGIAFVATNSICQGQQVPMLWPLVFALGQQIRFAHMSFKWANLASQNAGVTVVIVGLGRRDVKPKCLYSQTPDGATVSRLTENINAYLVPGPNIVIEPATQPPDERGTMVWGNKPSDGGHLLLSSEARNSLVRVSPRSERFVRRFIGAEEFIQGKQRYCLWISDQEREEAESEPPIATRIDAVSAMRTSSKAAETRKGAAFPHRFRQIQSTAESSSIVVPRVSSEHRPYLPVGLVAGNSIIGDRNFAFYDAPLWNLAVIASRLHWVWIGTVCVRMRTDFSYSNTLGWNTFPVPALTERQKQDLTRCAEEILLAREARFPATIADLYDPDKMPEDLRRAHYRNDETLERIYIGRKFRNDTERLEKLFDMYAEMTSKEKKPKKARAR